MNEEKNIEKEITKDLDLLSRFFKKHRKGCSVCGGNDFSITQKRGMLSGWGTYNPPDEMNKMGPSLFTYLFYGFVCHRCGNLETISKNIFDKWKKSNEN